MPTFAIAIRFNATPDAEPLMPVSQLKDHGLAAIPEVPGLFEGEGLAPDQLAALLSKLAEVVHEPEAGLAVQSGLLDDVWISIRRDG
ncbi:MAG: hypothetical protein ACFCBV_05815 [Phycisphaerales bacterium]